MHLPTAYLDRMQKLLGEEYQSYMKTLDEERFYGLRINTLKITPEEFMRLSDFFLEPIPWCKEGFYYDGRIKPGKHPHYYAGLYYIQEPSAMAPGSILDISPGDKVLDLCAAPGGKATHIGAKLKNKGVLVANDISPSRAQAVVRNIERWGIQNAVVSSEKPEKLTGFFPEYFDKIVVDAPCSGEGMFRKDSDLIQSWQEKGVESYLSIQRSILHSAGNMLAPGGQLLYSTCTFSPEENEGTIQYFLSTHPEFTVLPIEKEHNFASGRPDWIDKGSSELKDCVRLWPHRIKGEGHFIALLQKKYTRKSSHQEMLSISDGSKEDRKKLTLFHDFEEKVLQWKFDEELVIRNEKVYLMPKGLPDLKGLRILRSGWYLGDLKKNRFEPSQGLIMGLKEEDLNNSIQYTSQDNESMRYLKGETLSASGAQGWNGVTIDGYPVGWAKIQNHMLKNKMEKSWRWL